MKMTKYLMIAVVAVFLASCGGIEKPVENDPPTPVKTVKVPSFNADSAYDYIAKQVAFGPRLPNTAGHKACGEWMVAKLKSFGAKVYEQDFVATAYNGTKLQSKNIIGAFNPENKQRILLCAHWDTRHISDSELEAGGRNQPVMGADDGGSGVGVLLEIARILSQDTLGLGVDLVFFDSEDYGAPSDESDGTGLSWCLGSQYWSKTPHVGGYRAEFGILLDMVGSKSPRFTKEGTSMNYAPALMDKVWSLATSLGYGSFFDPTRTGGVTDDHLFVNRIANIPTIDIINRDLSTSSQFGKHWHTQNDNMDIIGKGTLKAVGQVVLHVIYKKDAGQFYF